ncbi:hypothetical protein GCM10010172_24200 [Paractinoplanes ferrugineus]|uniref:Uncharacterized protein n=1 Tax=Paractinoplanes ferrugineus TaxID=113564 RepID=A0A919IUY8_9ACTN|nr:hypothetical protein [Actinoplanes ferrugineus]GIE08669.1 hypothetical protein Afe05nite_05090 [Actinoplanes ferrugineus]
MSSKLSLGWDPKSSVEATAEEVSAADRYSRRLFDVSGALTRVELYRRGELVEVDYYAEELGSILETHPRDYPGIDFAIAGSEPAPAGFHWELTARYAVDGVAQRFVAELVDRAEKLIMGLEYAASGELIATTKFWYEASGEAGLMFEYASDGQNVGVLDLGDGDTPRFADVLRALPDPEFYTDGRMFPTQLTGVSSRSVFDRFRH